MSESDWRFAGCPVGEPSHALFTAIDKVGELLRPDDGRLWLELIKTARDLIIRSRAMEYLADGEMFAVPDVAIMGDSGHLSGNGGDQKSVPDAVEGANSS